MQEWIETGKQESEIVESDEVGVDISLVPMVPRGNPYSCLFHSSVLLCAERII